MTQSGPEVRWLALNEAAEVCGAYVRVCEVCYAANAYVGQRCGAPILVGASLKKASESPASDDMAAQGGVVSGLGPELSLLAARCVAMQLQAVHALTRSDVQTAWAAMPMLHPHLGFSTCALSGADVRNTRPWILL